MLHPNSGIVHVGNYGPIHNQFTCKCGHTVYSDKHNHDPKDKMYSCNCTGKVLTSYNKYGRNCDCYGNIDNLIKQENHID